MTHKLLEYLTFLFHMLNYFFHASHVFFFIDLFRLKIWRILRCLTVFATTFLHENNEEMDWDPIQLVLHAILIEWLRLKVNFLTFNLNHLIKNYWKIQKIKSKKMKILWKKKKLHLCNTFWILHEISIPKKWDPPWICTLPFTYIYYDEWNK